MEIDSSAQPDLIAELGYLCLGSRLKRLGERLQGGVAACLAGQGQSVQPAQLPLLMALHKQGPMTISGLSERIGISQPGISRAVAALQALGMVETLDGGRDRRQRRIGLTPPALGQMEAFDAGFFPAVERAVAALCAEAGGSLLGGLSSIEAALVRMPLELRIAREQGEGHGG